MPDTPSSPTDAGTGVDERRDHAVTGEPDGESRSESDGEPPDELDGDPSGVAAISDRIVDLATEASEAREGFDPPASPPATDRARGILHEGFGPVVWVYVEGRTGGRRAHFSPEEMGLLDRAMNDWLELYARCHGVDMDASFSVREAAELLVETHNVQQTAQVLTRLPER